jgi:2'-5' RNA ligase
MAKQIYALSIIPPQDVYDKLKSIVDDLSDRYNEPKFKPHITLVSEIRKPEGHMMEKCEELASQLKPFRVKLSKLGYLNRYYQCVFLLAEKSPELMEANQKAKKMFELPDKEYMPHISLLYGDKYTEQTKQKIIDEIGELSVEFEVDSFHLDHSSDEIPIEDWQWVKEFRFKG